MSTEDSVTIRARCLCKANQFTADIPKSSLPLEGAACHCDSCRHLTGALYTMGVPWPTPSSKVDMSHLKRFDFTDKVQAFFCPTCSTPLFWGETGSEDLGILCGSLENADVDLVRLKYHIFVEDTKDGGLSLLMRKPNADGVEVPKFAFGSSGEKKKELSSDWPGKEAFTGYEKRVQDEIPVRCKCRGVDLLLHKGNYANTKKEDLPWFVDPTTLKIEGSMCACDSCRLSFGMDVTTWTFAELVTISAGGKQFPKDTAGLKELVDSKDPSIGTLTYYKSSPDVQRYFCGNCSACIFYAVDDRPTIVDVAIGALEALDGARAEGFLTWDFHDASHDEDIKGGWRGGLISRITKESEAWRVERGYPEHFRKNKKE